MSNTPLMKDGLGKSAINRIASALDITVPGFNAKQFQRDALNGLTQLELKERVFHLISILHHHLPNEFTQTLKILNQIPHHWDPGEENDSLAGFAAWPLIDYISVYGLDYPEQSLATLKNLTALFSAEFAIRDFIINHGELTLDTLKVWTKDDNQHVRRLVSEGSRPRLPWGKRLPQFIDDPTPVIELLNSLKDDPSEYVRRSVANNLNDISKDNATTVIKICRQWKKKKSNERQWIIRHATRSLVKSGHPEVFALLDYTVKPNVSIKQFKLANKKIKMGDSLTFSFCLQSHSKSIQKLVIDFAIHYVKANGKTAPKVFKLKSVSLNPNEKLLIEKSVSFKTVTTRKHYAGVHRIELLINGKPYSSTDFKIIE